MHWHTVEEALVLDDGDAEVTLGDGVRRVGSGTVVFVPPGTPHGTRNVGGRPLALHAVFPTDVVTIGCVERNPRPGTEGRPPRPPFAIDVRALLRGDAAAAFRPLGATRSPAPSG